MKLFSHTNIGKKLIESCTDVYISIFPKRKKFSIDCTLVIITPVFDKKNTKFEYFFWEEIYNAWKAINSTHNNREIMNWRIIYNYGQQLFTGIKIFRLIKSEKPVFFYLLDKEDFNQALNTLNDLLCTLNPWHHIVKIRGFFHSSGIYHYQSGYIFVGPSGAGKSTICEVSSHCGYKKIHDDHIVVYRNKDGKYEVTDRTLSLERISLNAVFFIHKEKSDKLDKLSPLMTARGLFESCLDSVAKLVLYDDILESAFQISADIARNIPGYNLYFKKSPDFLEVINNELGNPQSG